MPDPARVLFPAVSSVLAVCAHPDDESFGLGAALSHLAARGARVSVLCFTRGEASTLYQSPEEFGTLRGAELETAAAELEVAEVVLLDQPDGHLADAPPAELAAQVSAVAQRVVPDLLLVFDEGGVTGHPDHRRATEAALAGAPLVPALAWAVPQTVAAALNAEFSTAFVGRDDHEIDLVLEVDREAQRRAIAADFSQCTDNPVLWRRLELHGNREAFRWLRPPRLTEGSDGHARDAQAVAAEWDARYRAQARLFREEPDDTLVELASLLVPGTALDLGAGKGRNSLWLAKQGRDVVAVDASAVALDRLRSAAATEGVTVGTVATDVFDYLQSASIRGLSFDLVIIAFVHPPAEERARLLAVAAERVAAGGYLFAVAHHVDSLGKTGPPDPERLYVEDDLGAVADGLEVVRLERRTGQSDITDPGVDAFLWAQRPAPPEMVLIERDEPARAHFGDDPAEGRPSDMSSADPITENEGKRKAFAEAEPSLAELSAALEEHVDSFGGVTAGVARTLRAERRWGGRLLDVLEIFSQSAELLGYMAGGRRPEEVSTWLAFWAESSLSLDQIRLIAEAGGWDPEPFVVLARAGLLEALLRARDGSIRHIRGERAGGWVSDELAAAGDSEVLAAARQVR